MCAAKSSAAQEGLLCETVAGVSARVTTRCSQFSNPVPVQGARMSSWHQAPHPCALQTLLHEVMHSDAREVAVIKHQGGQRKFRHHAIAARRSFVPLEI